MVGNRCGVAVSGCAALDRSVAMPLGRPVECRPFHLHLVRSGPCLAAQDLLKIPHGVP